MVETSISLESDIGSADAPKNEKDSVRRWHDRIATAKRFRNKIADRNRWEEFIKEYGGEYDVQIGGIIVPPINEIFAFVQTAISGMLFKDPFISVNPKKNSTIKAAKIKEAAVNYYWRELKIKQEMEKEVIDSLLVGHGWMKVGSAVKTVGKGEDLKLESEKLYAYRVSWRDVVFNIGTKDIGVDSLWIAQRIIKPLAEVKKRYPNTAKLKGTFHTNLDKKEQEKVLFKDDILFAILWEVWDAQNKKVYLIAEGQNEKYLKNDRWPEHIDEFPLIPLWYNHLPDEVYPLSDVAAWEPQVLEKIKIFTQVLNHQKRFSRQLLMKKKTMPEREKDKFEQGIDGAIIEHTSSDIRKDSMVFDFGSMNPDVYNILDRIDNIIRNVSGQAEFERGGITKTPTRTKGELELIKEGTNARSGRKVDRIETQMENIARHLIAEMKANFDLQQIVKITGNPPQEVLQAFGDNFNPQTKELTFTKEDILGEEDVEVKAGSTLPLDREGKQRILSEILQNLGPQVIQAGLTSPFIQRVITELLEGLDIKALELAFQQELQAAQQGAEERKQIQKFETAKIAMEGEKRKAQADKIDAETSQIEQQTRIDGDPRLKQALDVGKK